MKALCILLASFLIVVLDLIGPVYLQNIQSRHYRPLPDKCDRYGRCSAKEGYPEEVADDDAYKSEKGRPPILTRDDRPLRPFSDDYDRKKDDDKDIPRDVKYTRDEYDSNYPKPPVDKDDPKISDGNFRDDDLKSSGGGGYGGGYNPKPSLDKDEGIRVGGRPTGSDGYGGGSYKPKPADERYDDTKPVVSRPSVGGGGYGGGGSYKPKPADEPYDDIKPAVSRPSAGGGGYGGGGGYKPKPADEPYDDIKPAVSRPSAGGGGYGGGSYGGGGNKPKPVDERIDDIKPVVSRPSTGGGGYGGGSYGGSGYKPKPADERNDDIKPVVSRPSTGGGGYGGGSYGGGGYKPKPADERNDDIKPVVSRPSTGGGGYGGVGYKPKPADERDDDLKSGIGGSVGYDDENYKPKPALDRDDNIKPTVSRPSTGGGGYGGGGFKPKPVDDRDDDLKPVIGGSIGYDDGNYKPKPALDRDDSIKPTVNRPSTGGGGYGGGGFKPKPAVNDDDLKPATGRPNRNGGGYRGGYESGDAKGEFIPKPIDDFDIKPARGGDDLGGYNGPKEDNDNDYYEGNYEEDDKPIPAVDGNCICVPYYQCKDGHIVTDGAGIIDARKRPDPDDELPLDGKFKPPSCGPYHVCCNTPESSTVKPYEHRCGVRNPSGINSRILSPSNKGEADFGEWPWQAAVLKSEGKVNIFQCGGVLIDKYHVLTVAHCVFHLYQLNEYPLKVRLGEWDTQTTTEFLAHEDYKVSKIIIHPEFRNTSLWNDVAVLRLQDPVLFAPHIDTVCLPQYDEMFSGQNCVVTGWGKDAYKGGTFSNVMKEVALQVIDNYKCEEMLRKTRLGRFFQLHEGFLCAGGEYGLDSCKGDGGGPLVCYRKDKSYALAGIVSWGIDCGQPGVPGVYVKIQKYLDWISKTTSVSLQEYWPKH